MKKFIVFTFYGYSLQIAYKLLQEGNEVVVAMVKNISDMGNGDKPEEPELKKQRLSLYDGILDKYDANSVIKSMENIKNKDEVFVFFDLNTLWKYSEKCLKMGFTNGIFPTRADLKLEQDRDAGKAIVKKYYPDLEVAEVHEFKNIQEGIKFVEESDKFLVLKGNCDDADTVVPNTKILEFSKNEIIDALNKDKSIYENGGFILEEKIIDPIEITPEAIFYNGEFVSATIDIEAKPRSAGDEGEQCGCALDLVFPISQDDKIFKIAFPKFVFEEAKKRKGIYIIDAGILCKDGKYYFTEFCSQRFGWDSLQTEISMSRGVGDFFNKIIKGKNQYTSKFGVSVKGFAPNNDKYDLKEEKYNWLESADKDIWMYDLKLNENGDPVNSTMDWDKVVFTGQGKTIMDAVDRAYEVRDSFTFPGLEVRPRFDFLSREYFTSIMNRYDYIINSDILGEKEELINEIITQNNF